MSRICKKNTARIQLFINIKRKKIHFGSLQKFLTLNLRQAHLRAVGFKALALFYDSLHTNYNLGAEKHR